MKDSKTIETRNLMADVTDAARFLAARRRRARITQAAIAFKIGRSRKWVSEFERGKNRAVSLLDILVYSNALGYSLAFFDVSDVPPAGEELSAFRGDHTRDSFSTPRDDPAMDLEER